MTAYYWKTSKFKKLSDKWAKKLAKSGFKDIEEPNSPTEMLKRWDGTYFTMTVKTEEKFHDIQDYYLRCAHMLNIHPFKTKLDKLIWKYYSEGFSTRKIGAKLKYHHSYIHRIIKRLKQEIKW